MNVKKYVILCAICASAFPSFAQQGSIAGKVIRSIASKRAIVPQVKIVSLPAVRPLVLTEELATPYLFMADDLYKKASFAKRFTPQTNLVTLGVRGPVTAMERFVHQDIAIPDPNDPFGEEFLFDVETSPRYKMDGTRDVLAGWENVNIIRRNRQNKTWSAQLKEARPNILAELSQGQVNVGMHGVFNRIATEVPSLDVIAIGQLPYFRTLPKLADEMKTFVDRIRQYAPQRPIVLVTPFLAKGVVLTDSAANLGPLEPSAPVQQVGVFETAVANKITVVGTGLFSRYAEEDFVFYDGETKSMPGFEDTAMGQLEQQNFLTDVLKKYREENPSALIILWAPTEFVAYNGFNSVTADLKQANQKVKVVQITGTDNAVTRFEKLLPAQAREEFSTYPGLTWPEESGMWRLSGADAFIRVPGKIQP